MTSLRAAAPVPGGGTRRKDRGSSAVWRDEEQENRVRHVVIREAEIVRTPSSHVVYKINVLTQWNHWCVLRRYSEFFQLHTELVQRYGIARDLLPPKRLTGNFSPKLIEVRREALEHYLQRLVNSQFEVATSKLVRAFLDVQSHDVMQVAKRLSRRAFEEGEAILSNRRACHYTPTEMFCICKRLKLPMADGDRTDGASTDLSHLYSFINQLEALSVSVPPGHPSLCNMPFSLAHFRSLRSLSVDTCPVALLEGISTLRGQLRKLALHHILNSVKAIIEDAAAEKRGQSSMTASSSGSGLSMSGVESWRHGAVVSMTTDRPVVLPWPQLTHLDVSRNRISALDDSLRLLPALQEANFSFNMIQGVDLNRIFIPSLKKVNLAHNHITSLTASNREHRLLQELILSHNRLRSLEGVEAFSQLRVFAIDHNSLAIHSDLAPLSEMAQLRTLHLTANPFSQKRGYRVGALAMLPHCVNTVVIDNAAITPAEQARLEKISQQYGSDTLHWPDSAFRRSGSFSSLVTSSQSTQVSNSQTVPSTDSRPHRHSSPSPDQQHAQAGQRTPRLRTPSPFASGQNSPLVTATQGESSSRASSTSPSSGENIRGNNAAEGSSPVLAGHRYGQVSTPPQTPQATALADLPLPPGEHRVIRLDSRDASDDFSKNPFNNQRLLEPTNHYLASGAWSPPEQQPLNQQQMLGSTQEEAELEQPLVSSSVANDIESVQATPPASSQASAVSGAAVDGRESVMQEHQLVSKPPEFTSESGTCRQQAASNSVDNCVSADQTDREASDLGQCVAAQSVDSSCQGSAKGESINTLLPHNAPGGGSGGGGDGGGVSSCSLPDVGMATEVSATVNGHAMAEPFMIESATVADALSPVGSPLDCQQASPGDTAPAPCDVGTVSSSTTVCTEATGSPSDSRACLTSATASNVNHRAVHNESTDCGASAASTPPGAAMRAVSLSEEIHKDEVDCSPRQSHSGVPSAAADVTQGS